jgi:hypothetical protein
MIGGLYLYAPYFGYECIIFKSALRLRIARKYFGKADSDEWRGIGMVVFVVVLLRVMIFC